MSARAAARLESMGFAHVYRYTAGKVDWLANGWPVEGLQAGRKRAGDLARQDVPTCRLLDRVGTVVERLRLSPYPVCVVVNDASVVLGWVGQEELQADSNTTIEQVMDCSPRTYRFHARLEKAAEYMQEHEQEVVLVTRSDGRLLGVLTRQDVAAALSMPEESGA